jgi:hypothetical protein
MGLMSGAVEVQARPDSIVVNPSATAIIVVDMQNDFAYDYRCLRLSDCTAEPIGSRRR